MPKISIIIPAYNAEKYIKETIESIIFQSYNDWEVIVVDDGSIDNTSNIVEEYVKNNSKIRLIKQINSGAGVARNKGLELAVGDYLLFLDADDFLVEESLRLIAKDLHHGTEVIIYDGYNYIEKTKNITPGNKLSFNGEEGIYLTKELCNQIFQLSPPYPSTKVFNKNFILQCKIRFQEIKRVNDLFFSYASIAGSDRVLIRKEKIAYYRKGVPGSLSDRRGQWDGMLSAALTQLKNFLDEKELYSLYKDSFDKLIIESGGWEMLRTGNKEAFIVYMEKYYGNFLTKLKTKENNNYRLLEHIESNDELIIYGAGDVAEVLLNIFIWVCEIDKNRIKVVVSKADEKKYMRNSEIEIEEIKNINKKHNSVVIVAVDNTDTRKKMLNNAKKLGFDSCLEAGYYEIGLLMRKLLQSSNLSV